MEPTAQVEEVKTQKTSCRSMICTIRLLACEHLRMIFLSCWHPIVLAHLHDFVNLAPSDQICLFFPEATTSWTEDSRPSSTKEMSVLVWLYWKLGAQGKFQPMDLKIMSHYLCPWKFHFLSKALVERPGDSSCTQRFVTESLCNFKPRTPLFNRFLLCIIRQLEWLNSEPLFPC